jgi:glycerol-3-phosphate dehydrogenase subunit C
MVEECSAVDGTWGMKAEHYEMGRKYAQPPRAHGVAGLEPDVVVSDCSARGAARRRKRTSVRVVHPVEALARGLRPDLVTRAREH